LTHRDSELTFLTRRWFNGESSLPLIQRLREMGHHDEAAAWARLALRDPDCKDRAALEAALQEISGAPDDWLDALADFARAPSEQRWDALMQFVPEEVFYHRLRNTIATLMRLGCDGNALFRCATKSGITSDVFDLASSGTVDPHVIEQRGDASPARPMWLGLAAQAAFARGDRFAVIRYLREASRDEGTAFFAWASISEIRDRADEELNAELDRVGVPRV
jgi:hypothetical protein